MAESTLGITLVTKDESTPTLTKAGQAYVDLAKKVVDAEKAQKSLEKAQKDYDKIAAQTSDQTNPRLAAAFNKLAEAIGKNEAAQKALERAQNGTAESSRTLSQAVTEAKGKLTELADKAFAPAVSQLTSIVEAAGPAGVALAALAAATVAIAKTMGEWALQAAEAGREIELLAERIGTTTEFASTMSAVIGDAGGSVGDLQTAFKSLEKNIGENSKNFKELGVNIFDSKGKAKDAEVVFFEVADKIAAMGSKYERSAAAQEIFGKAGLTLLPILEQGSTGIRKLQEEARAYGHEISTNTAIKSKRLHDAVDDLGDAFANAKRKVGEAFIPVMTRVVEEALLPVGKAAVWVADQFKAFVEWFDKAGEKGGQFAALIKRAGIETAASLLPGVGAAVKVADAFADLGASTTEAKDEAKSALAEIKDAFMGPLETDQQRAERKERLAEEAAEEKKRAKEAAAEKKRQAKEEADNRKSILVAIRRAEQAAELEKVEQNAKNLKKLEEQAEQHAEKLKKDIKKLNKEIEVQRLEDVARAREAQAALGLITLESQESIRKTFAENYERMAEENDEFEDRVTGSMGRLATSLGEAALKGGGAFTKAIGAALSDITKRVASFLVSAAIKAFFKFLTGAIGNFILPGAGTFLGGLVGAITGAKSGGIIDGPGRIQRFAGGGIVEGLYRTGQDTVPALLQPGEIVLPRSISQALRGSAPAPAPSSGRAVTINISSFMPSSQAETDRLVRDSILPSLRRQGVL